jgi:hypothetical protein
MVEIYKNIDKKEALQELKRSARVHIIIYKCDLLNCNSTREDNMDAEEIIKSASTIILNKDNWLQHMQCYTIKQDDINNIKREGIMYDIIY